MSHRSTASRLALSRRDLPKAGIAISLPLAAILAGRASAQDTPTPDNDELLPATPAIADDDDLTPEQTEGPYYTPDSPERTSLREEGISGTNLTIAGFVVNTRGETIPDVLVDIWHADNDGVYDNEGYRLRGHQFADDQGRWAFETIQPGLYPGRTRHIHVKVQPPDGDTLTTQLYFPDEETNAEDGIYDAALEMEIQPDALEDGSRLGLFTFVLDTA